jgi:hypothetical protein
LEIFAGGEADTHLQLPASSTQYTINGTPFCTGFTPTNGQFLQYTTASSPDPCYTAASNLPSLIVGTTSTDGTPSPSLQLGAGNSPWGAVLLASVWDRKQITLPSSGCVGYGEPSVIQDTNAQLLAVSPSTVIFKAIFTGLAGLCYEESLDGITGWTNQVSPIIANYARSFFLHAGSTYYVFAVPLPGQNEIDLYSAANSAGPYTLAQGSVIALGSGSAWDSATLATCSVILDGSTWRMLYEAKSATVGFQTGSATATSLTGPWTKYAGNPVMGSATQSASSPFLWKDTITGLFWNWGHTAYSGLGVGDLPTDILRWGSPDFNAWTQNPRALTIPRIYTWEGARNLGGQTANPSLVSVGASTYLYYAYTLQQGGPGGIALATAPLTMHQLVGTDEGATISYTAMSLFPQPANQGVFNIQMPLAGNLNIVNRIPYTSTAGTSSSNPVISPTTLYFNPTFNAFTFSAGSSNHGAQWNWVGGQTALVNGASFTPTVGYYCSTSLYCGNWWPGVYTNDQYAGKDATTDDFIFSTADTASPQENFRVLHTGSLKAAHLGGTGTGDVSLCWTTTGVFTQGAVCGTSARRFKQHIARTAHGLDWLMRMKPVTFQYRPDQNAGAEKHLGFIADDLQAISPLFAVAVDGKIQNYDDRAIIATLVKAVQELSAKVQELQNRGNAQVGVH